jgi:hypothetical protein
MASPIESFGAFASPLRRQSSQNFVEGASSSLSSAASPQARASQPIPTSCRENTAKQFGTAPGVQHELQMNLIRRPHFPHSASPAFSSSCLGQTLGRAIRRNSIRSRPERKPSRAQLATSSSVLNVSAGMHSFSLSGRLPDCLARRPCLPIAPLLEPSCQARVGRGRHPAERPSSRLIQLPRGSPQILVLFSTVSLA